MRKRKLLALVIMVGLLVALAAISGCAPAATPEGGTGSSGYTMIIFIILIFGVFYFFTIRPQRKKQKQHQNLVSALKKGDKVITAGGIYGQIENINEENAVLKVESGATIRVLRNGIIGKQEK